MSLENWEIQQRKRGNLIAAQLGRILRKGFGDFSLHGEEERFTPEFEDIVHEMLIKAGFEILPPIEGSPNKIEMAFNPRRLFLPGSVEVSSKDQERMFEKQSRLFVKTFPGTKVIIGEDVDYRELLNRYLTKHRDKGFGKREGYLYTRTKTPEGKGIICVSMFDIGGEIQMRVWDGKPSPLVGLTSIIVPAFPS